MATQTPRRHPRKDEQIENRYPFPLTLKNVDKTTAISGLFCAYEPTPGGESGTFQTQDATGDRLRIPQWVAEAATNQIAVVTMGNAGDLRFKVLDVVPTGDGPDATVLIVEPRN